MPDVLYSSYILRDHGQAGDIRATADERSSLCAAVRGIRHQPRAGRRERPGHRYRQLHLLVLGGLDLD